MKSAFLNVQGMPKSSRNSMKHVLIEIYSFQTKIEHFKLAELIRQHIYLSHLFLEWSLIKYNIQNLPLLFLDCKFLLIDNWSLLCKSADKTSPMVDNWIHVIQTKPILLPVISFQNVNHCYRGSIGVWKLHSNPQGLMVLLLSNITSSFQCDSDQSFL